MTSNKTSLKAPPEAYAASQLSWVGGARPALRLKRGCATFTDFKEFVGLGFGV